jgi:uncharacterized protein YdeI (YjbR/CyaY-like superfamily)
MSVSEPDPIFFADEAGFRAWLAENHTMANEVWVGFYRKDSGLGGMGYPAAVDQALCFGWIDGIRKKLDERSYANRFTPRKPRSNWSNVNIKRVAELTAEGRMAPSGVAAFEARTAGNSGVYSFEQPEAAFPGDFAARFAANQGAWDFFLAQAPHYRRAATHWVLSAKREETRLRRLETLIADSAAGLWISLMRRPTAG